MPMDPMLYLMLANSSKSPDAAKDPMRNYAMMSALGGMMTPMGAGGPGGAPRQSNPVGDALDQFSQQMMMRKMLDQMNGQKSSGGIMDMFGMGGGSSKGGPSATNGSAYSGMAAGFGGSPLG